ncbi:MAG TPA: type II toxin-antitoxin system VapC family toxin [Gammaproteobacteria bacterium]|nr:type II toxin-antitoxin system VapC family toxin [Gammaproteobacteria bacterium]
MIAVDTNVLLRALVDDPTDPAQCGAARALVAGAGQVRVASIVFVETLWVLHRRYRAARDDVSRVARELLDHPRYQIEASDELSQALEIFSTSSVDFADAVALADARRAGVGLHTFDRRLAKLPDATIVQ